MKFRYTLELLTVITVAAFCLLFLYAHTTFHGSDFTGSDTAGSDLIANLSGTTIERFQPLIPQWKPPNGEVESCLFALQAAIGGILVGGVFGYWVGQRNKA